MRDERIVYAIAAVLEKRLHTHVCVVQGPRFTEWRVGDRGFAIGPHIDSYPLKALVNTIQKYMTPPVPVKKKDEED